MANNTTTTNNNSGPRFKTTLPREIITDILTQHLVEPSVCALSVLCPDWNLCRPRHVALDAILRTTRVDTYTLPTSPTTQGSITTTFDHPHSHAHTCSNHPNPHGTHDDEDSRGYWCHKAHHSYRQQQSQNQHLQKQEEFHLPILRDPRPSPHHQPNNNPTSSALPASYTRELVRAWATSSVVAATQRPHGRGVVGPLWAPMAPEVVREMVLLRDEGAVGLLPYRDDFLAVSEEEEKAAGMKGGEDGDVRGWRVFAVDGREKEMLPMLPSASAFNDNWGGVGRGGGDDGPRYLYQRLRHLVLNTAPELASLSARDLGMMPATRNQQVDANLHHLAERLNYERKASVMLRWDAMERLETLCLDLRGYSLLSDWYLNDADVLELASSLAGKGLSLLVIAGLRSGENYPGPDPLELEDAEGGSWDSEMKAWVDVRMGGAIKWWMVFRDALRPGGRLVFVDKEEVDSSNWALLQPLPRHRGNPNIEQGA